MEIRFRRTVSFTLVWEEFLQIFGVKHRGLLRSSSNEVGFVFCCTVEAERRALPPGCDLIHCIQGSILGATGSMVISESDGGRSTFNNQLHLCAFSLIPT